MSFHFGLPEPDLLQRVKATGAKILSSANSVQEARWLEDRGCDAIIAQGFEAGGHQAMFLTDNISTQVGTMALVPQVVDAVKVPVIAAGGIADARGIAAAFALGASGVQIGTAYLFCPEATIRPVHREALKRAKENETALTNVFTGRPARGIMNRAMREIGPMSEGTSALRKQIQASQPWFRCRRTRATPQRIHACPAPERACWPRCSPWDSRQFSELTKQSGESRIAAGLHYRFDCDAGDEIGRRAAALALAKLAPALR